MGRIIIVNGSPRAPKSNSKQYAALFKNYWQGEISEYDVTAKKHAEICGKLNAFDDLLLVFPLYTDGLPATLLQFLKELEKYPISYNPRVHAIINCGFMEPEQNQPALEMIKLFCRQHGHLFGSALCIGGGEAILTTPFVFFVKRNVKKLAKAIWLGKPTELRVTMPLSKKSFLKASKKYWIRYGEKHHVNIKQMETMKIEDEIE